MNKEEGAELASLILVDAETKGYLYTTMPSFSTVTADGEYGIYSTEDDLGVSYYFGGNVTNNYVEFGSYAEDITIKLYNEYDGEKIAEIKTGDPMYW